MNTYFAFLKLATPLECVRSVQKISVCALPSARRNRYYPLLPSLKYNSLQFIRATSILTFRTCLVYERSIVAKIIIPPCSSLLVPSTFSSVIHISRSGYLIRAGPLWYCHYSPRALHSPIKLNCHCLPGPLYHQRENGHGAARHVSRTRTCPSPAEEKWKLLNVLNKQTVFTDFFYVALMRLK